MGFFKDYKDETVNGTDALAEDGILDADDIFGDEIQDLDDDGSAEDYDEEVDEDLLYSLLNDDVTEAIMLPEDGVSGAAVQDKKEIAVNASPVTRQPEKEDPKPVKPEVKELLTEEEKRAVTVITKGTTINGSIISDCSLEVMGTINGDVECLGKLTISGKVVGNTSASEVYVNTERLQGSITSEGSVKIGLGTVVIGNINASSGVIAGAVKGEIDVDGPIVIDSTAIIKGNVKAGAIQMNNGAVLEGFCSLSNSSVDIDTIFE